MATFVLVPPASQPPIPSALRPGPSARTAQVVYPLAYVKTRRQLSEEALAASPAE